MKNDEIKKSKNDYSKKTSKIPLLQKTLANRSTKITNIFKKKTKMLKKHVFLIILTRQFIEYKFFCIFGANSLPRAHYEKKISQLSKNHVLTKFQSLMKLSIKYFKSFRYFKYVQILRIIYGF